MFFPRAIPLTTFLLILWGTPAIPQTIAPAPVPLQNRNLSLRIEELDVSMFPRVTMLVKLFDGALAVRDTAFKDIDLTENMIPQDAEMTCAVRSFAAVLVLDRSLSMSYYPNTNVPDPDSTRWNSAKSALHVFIDRILPIDRLALISFCRTVKTEQSWTSNTTLLHDVLEGITLDQGTAIWKAVNSAIDLLVPVSEKRAIVLLTDGEDNSSGTTTMDYVATRAASLGIRVYTVGLGQEVSRTLLGTLASRTGGKFYFSATGSDLTDIYNQISSDLADGCTVTYRSTNFCQDGTQRDIRITGFYGGDSAKADTSYIAPYNVPHVQLSFAEPAPISAGKDFLVPVLASDTIDASEPLSFRAVIRYPSSDLDFIGLSTERRVLEGIDVRVEDIAGLLTLSVQRGQVHRAGVVLCDLLFRANPRRVAAVIPLSWDSFNLERRCPFQIETTDAVLMLDGFCEPLLARRTDRFLRSNFPNPFHAFTVIPIDIPAATSGMYCEVRILDPLGNVVAQPFSGILTAGEHLLTWDGSGFPSGMYTIELTGDGHRERKQALLLR
ncbi:MAG: VWA domain-containing protein [Bacteroidota bacterium]|nr:VWA domain-containing protein [Bacteroidota bacterium]